MNNRLPTENENVLSLLTPHVQTYLSNQKMQSEFEHEQDLRNLELQFELEKKRIEGESEFDFRNKIFIGVALLLAISAVTALACLNKLNDGLLSIFSMLIGSLFTAYAAGMQIISKGKARKKDN